MNWLAAMADSPDGEGCEPPSTVAANDIERDTCGKADRCGAEVTEIFARSRGNRNRSPARNRSKTTPSGHPPMTTIIPGTRDFPK